VIDANEIRVPAGPAAGLLRNEALWADNADGMAIRTADAATPRIASTRRSHP